MSQFRMVRVSKPGGGHRMQRAMVLASGKLKFVKNTGVKNTGRATAAHRSKPVAKKAKHRKSTAIAHRRSSTPRHHKGQSKRRRRSGGGFGSVPVIPVALTAAGLAYVTGASGPKQVRDLAMKIPGAKTFGPLAVAGGACLVADRFIKRNKWLRLAGIVGVAAAAMKVGEQGAGFKWLGDADDDIGDYDLMDVDGDDDDIGDVDDVGDDED